MAQYLDKDGLDNLLSMINNNFVKFGDLSIPKPKMIACTQVEDWSYEDFETFASEFIGENPVVFYMSELATVSPLTLVVNEDGMCEFHSICKVNETSMVKVVISATADEEGNYTVTQNLVEIPLEGGSGEVPTKTSELTNDSGFITANDNVASATKLQTMRYINGLPFDGTSNVVSYAVCTTGASVSVKTVNISNFNLITGSQVRVKFNNTNTATAPTLNVGSTGAKSMKYKGNLITNANFNFSNAKIYTFTYDGTFWVLEGDWDEVPKTNILTCEFMGEVGDVIWSDGDDHDRIDYIADWMEALSMGKVCVLDFDEYEGTYAMVHAINYRNDTTYGIGKVYFSYVFEGYLYDVEYESVSLPVTLTIVNKTKIGGEGGGSSEGGVYLTPFTVEQFVSGYVELTDEQRNELLDAASNNKIIGMPHSDATAGYVLVEYRYHTNTAADFWSLILAVVYLNVYYDNIIGSNISLNFTIGRLTTTPLLQASYTVSVEDGIANVDEALGYPDNSIYLVEGECTELNINLEPSVIGKTVRFFTGENCSLFFGNDAYWANGELPTIEPYTHYELSLVVNAEYGFNAVLTPFKLVES